MTNRYFSEKNASRTRTKIDKPLFLKKQIGGGIGARNTGGPSKGQPNPPHRQLTKHCIKWGGRPHFCKLRVYIVASYRGSTPPFLYGIIYGGCCRHAEYCSRVEPMLEISNGNFATSRNRHQRFGMKSAAYLGHQFLIVVNC